MGNFSINFLESQGYFDVLFQFFKLLVMQHAPNTSKRVLIIGGWGGSYLANIQDQDETRPKLLIHA